MCKIKWNKYKKEKGKLLFSGNNNKVHIYLVDVQHNIMSKYHVWDEEKLKTIAYVDTIKEAKRAAIDYLYYF